MDAFVLDDGTWGYAPQGNGNAHLVWHGEDLYVVPGESVQEPTARFDVLRSVDGGQSWEPLAEGLPATTGGITLIDPECLSNGQTLYQVVAYSALDAETAALLTVTADSGAFWLSTGDGYQQTARLPWDKDQPPQFSIDAKRARSSEHYGGRALPVAYAGHQITRGVSFTGVLVDGEPDNPTRAALEDVFLAPFPVHLLRSPDGDRVYVQLTDTPLSRDAGSLWAFQVQAVEVERPDDEAVGS